MSSHESTLTLVIVIVVAVSVVPQFGFADETATPSVDEGAVPTTPSEVNYTRTTASTTEYTTSASTTEYTTSASTDHTTTPTAAEIQANAIAASRNVRTYQVRALINRTVSTSRINRTVNVTSRSVFNRTAREFRSNQTTRSPTRTVGVTTYLVDNSLYVRSDAFVKQYSSKWVTTDLSGDVDQRWQLLDTLARQRILLSNSSVTRVRTTTLDGTRTYVLQADVNETAYDRALATRFTGRTINVTNASFTFWIATESGRILQSRGTVTSTTTLRGQSVTIAERLLLRFEAYNATVSVTLPDAAATAVQLDNRTTTANQSHHWASGDVLGQ